MSEQDDWAAFVAMMEREGWVVERHDEIVVFWHGQIEYDPIDGQMYNDVGDAVGKPVGDWRTWLAAGSSPVPF